jgi:hypothetical protein
MNQGKVISVYNEDGTLSASYSMVPDAPYIQILADSTEQGEPVFVANTQADFDAMVDAVRRLADLREWLGEQIERRRGLLLDKDVYERYAYQVSLMRLNKESGQQ